MPLNKTDLRWSQSDLRSLAEALTGIAKQMRETLLRRIERNLVRLDQLRQTPEQIDRASRDKYAWAVDHQRQVGLAFVRQEAARVRAELGLEDA